METHKEPTSTSKTSLKKKLKILLYMGTALAIIFWVSMGITRLWEHNITITTAANHALLVELSGKLQNLPQPSTIQIGSTAGGADQLIEKYRLVLKDAESLGLAKTAFYIQGDTHKQIKKLSTEARDTIETLSQDLKTTTDILDTTKKFLQYDPSSDLAGIVDGTETDPSERLSRTASGIQSTVDQLSVYKTNSDCSKIIALLTPLVEQAKDVSATNILKWFDSVRVAQQNILGISDSTFTAQRTQHSQRLTALAESYLDLRP